MSTSANESVIYVYSELVNPVSVPEIGASARAVMDVASSPAVRICCELSEILTPAPDFRCTTSQSSTEDPVTKELLNLTQAWETVWTGFPACANEAYEWRLSDRPFTVSEATLHLPGSQTYDFGEFCVGKTIQEEDYVFVALTCQKKDWQSVFYTILLVNSIIFLALTIFHHVKNKWSLFTRLHNWLQVAYLVMTLIACACLAAFRVLKILAPQLLLQASEMDVVCTVLGYALDFSFISAFCWLTALNLDLWLVFGCKLPTATLPSKTGASTVTATGAANAGAVKKLVVFVTGGFLLPILFTWQKEHFEFPKTWMDPRNETETWVEFNQNSAWAWFGGAQTPEDSGLSLGASCSFTTTTTFPFLYPPVCILLLVNIIFHLATLISARRRKASPTPMPYSSSCNAKHWTMLTLFVKVFGLTVLLWAAAFAQWAVGTFAAAAATTTDEGSSSSPAAWPWVPILVNSLAHSQGIVVFVLYVWTGNLYRRVRGKFIVLASRVPKSGRSGGGGAKLESVSSNERAAVSLPESGNCS